MRPIAEAVPHATGARDATGLDRSEVPIVLRGKQGSLADPDSRPMVAQAKVAPRGATFRSLSKNASPNRHP